MFTNKDTCPNVVSTVSLLQQDGSEGSAQIIRKWDLTPEMWHLRLNQEQFRVVRDHGTEPADCGLLVDEKETGIYFCVGCGLPLFRSDSKFFPNTGWPGLLKPFSNNNLEEAEDLSSGVLRTEIVCARCGDCLGYVLSGDSKPKDLNYCLNPIALKFLPASKISEAPRDAFSNAAAVLEIATFAAGCFWGVEEAFRNIPGVVEVETGYTGGHTENPNYKQVSTDTTGHVEAVALAFDPLEIDYKALLETFFTMHDPTQFNRQGPDHGAQYRSAIFTHSPEQQSAAEKAKRELDASGRFENPIVTEITPAGTFWRAEEHHQRYFEKSRGVGCHI